MIRDVSDLEVYNESLELLALLYGFLRKVPYAELDTINQCKRASKSIPANIAEGFAKKSYEKEFKRFLKIAIGSSDEMIAHLQMISIIIPKISEESKELALRYKVLSKKLTKLHSLWNINSY